MEPCKQEEKLGQLLAIMTGIVKEHYGNGHEGIVKTIPRLEGSIHNLTETMKANTSVIANLVEFQAGLKAIDHYKDKEGLSSRQRVGLWISGIIGLSSITTALIIKFA